MEVCGCLKQPMKRCRNLLTHVTGRYKNTKKLLLPVFAGFVCIDWQLIYLQALKVFIVILNYLDIYILCWYLLVCIYYIFAEFDILLQQFTLTYKYLQILQYRYLKIFTDCAGICQYLHVFNIYLQAFKMLANAS